jgi:KDO2-lipid IV(A) lauroyltransferase
VKFYLLKVGEFIARGFPRRVAYGVARRVADLYILFDRQGREAVIANLNRIHSHGGVRLSRRALRVLARENFLNFAKYLVDFFTFLHLQPDRINRLIDFRNLRPTLDALLAEKKGLIILTAHLGNWELGGAVVAQMGYPFNAVALWQPDPKLNQLYQSYRIARGIKVIPFGHAARGSLLALRRGEILGLVGERDYSPSRDTVEFFGQPARLPHGPARLALATGAPILPCFLVRVVGDRYEYIVGEPIRVGPGCDTVPAIMERIARTLERGIRAHSEQWYLFHNPWDVERDRELATAAAFGTTLPVIKQEARPLSHS